MGSTSVSEALSQLGYSVNHYCPITHQTGLDFELDNLNLESPHSLVSTGSNLGELLCEFVRNGTRLSFPVLILTRDMIKWEESIHAWGRSRLDFSDDLKNYRYLLDNMPPNFFKFNVEEGWVGLCPLLNAVKPTSPFPRVNVGPPSWTI